MRHLSSPGLIKHEIGKAKTVFIDEIQRIPSILNTVQSLIDSKKQLKFYLTGASARKLKRGKANLLPGRLLSYEMGPLSHGELGHHFDSSRALSIGLLPGIFLEEDLKEAQKTLRTYAIHYLKEEIQAEALTRNLEGFSRFLNVIIAKSGEFLDLTKFASQAMIERMSARRYFDVLVDTLIVQELEAFTSSAKRRLIQHPRFFIFDVGVLNGALGNFIVSKDRIGNLFEHLVLQLLLSEAKANADHYRISNYRTNHGNEVDFIFERNQDVFAIEVKATQNVDASDLRGLKNFKEFYGKKHQSILIYMGRQKLIMDGIEVLPLEEAIALIFS